MINFNKQTFCFFRKLNWALTLALFFNFLFAFAISDDTKKYLWVKSDSFTNTSEIGDIVKNAYRSGYDGIFLQLEVHENPQYNPLLDKDINIQKYNDVFDPLKSAIYWGSKYDIEIHCWINAYKIWSYRKPPSHNHVFNYLRVNNKSWFARDINGFSDYKISFDSDKSYIDSWNGIFLSPLNDDVNEYIKNIIRKILENYSNLNGIHLDYLRYKDSMYGFNFDGCMEFYNIYGVNPLSLNKGMISKRFGWSEKSALIAQEEWNTFKTDKISSLVNDINEMIINFENNSELYDVALSVAVKPSVQESKNRWGQFWVDWLRRDILDFVVVMNYAKDIESFSSILWTISNEVTFEEQKKIYIGINTIDNYLNTHKLREIDIIKQQVRNSIDFDYIGLSIFSYEYFDLDKKLYMKIF